MPYFRDPAFAASSRYLEVCRLIRVNQTALRSITDSDDPHRRNFIEASVPDDSHNTSVEVQRFVQLHYGPSCI